MNWALCTGSLLGASSILLGALGAHGMDDLFDEFPAKKKAFHNAVDYQLSMHSSWFASGVSNTFPI